MLTRASLQRRQRLTFWVGACYLVLFLLGPWAHEHVDGLVDRDGTAWVHHVHSFDHGGTPSTTETSGRPDAPEATGHPAVET